MNEIMFQNKIAKISASKVSSRQKLKPGKVKFNEF